jgi:transposase
MLSQTSVGRIIKLYKETGGTKPKPREYGPRPVVSDEILAKIKQETDADSSTTIPKIMEKLHLSCSRDAVRNAIIKRLRHSFKKTLAAAERQPPANAEKRAEYIKIQKFIPASKIVFLDETGINTGMAKPYGWGKGRVKEHVPDARRHSMTLISAVSLEGPLAPFMFERALNGAIFSGYAEKFLIPSLPRESVLAMDSLPARKAARARAAFLKAGIHILYITPYSPVLNPAQMMWAKLKGILNEEKPRAQEALAGAAGSALGQVAQGDIEGWFCMTDTHV